jgi:PST family polysaccharide transporter
VAVGVAGALAINFLLMAQLSLKISGMRWGEFIEAHVPALKLSAVSGLAAWSMIILLRHWHLPAAVRFGIAGALGLLVVAVLSWRLPHVFLGGDGRWMMDFLRAYLSKRLRPAFGQTEAVAAGSTAPGGP